MTALIIGCIIALIAFFVVMTYKSLIAKAEAVENSKKQIDVQLDRRFKVFEGLISTVRKVMDYEQTVLKEIVQLRSQAQGARRRGDEQSQFEAEEKITQIASQINVVFEQYPQLGALDNSKQLQEEIVSTESKLSSIKKSYNESIDEYNFAKKSFLSSMVVNMFASKLSHNHQYWQLNESKHKEYEEVISKI